MEASFATKIYNTDPHPPPNPDPHPPLVAADVVLSAFVVTWRCLRGASCAAAYDASDTTLHSYMRYFMPCSACRR